MGVVDEFRLGDDTFGGDLDMDRDGELAVAQGLQIEIPTALDLGPDKIPHIVERLMAEQRIVVDRFCGCGAGAELGGGVRLAEFGEGLKFCIERIGR